MGNTILTFKILPFAVKDFISLNVGPFHFNMFLNKRDSCVKIQTRVIQQVTHIRGGLMLMSLQNNDEPRQLMSPLVRDTYVSFPRGAKTFRKFTFLFPNGLTNKLSYMKNYILPLAMIFLFSCNLHQEDPSPGGPWERCDPADRVGCLCNNGDRFNSTDATVCDNSGGLDRYICRFE